MATAQPDFLRQDEIIQEGPMEHFDTCRSFLHDGWNKVLKIHPWPLPYLFSLLSTIYACC